MKKKIKQLLREKQLLDERYIQIVENKKMALPTGLDVDKVYRASATSQENVFSIHKLSYWNKIWQTIKKYLTPIILLSLPFLYIAYLGFSRVGCLWFN